MVDQLLGGSGEIHYSELVEERVDKRVYCVRDAGWSVRREREAALVAQRPGRLGLCGVSLDSPTIEA